MATVDSSLFHNFGNVRYDPLLNSASVIRDVTFADDKFSMFRNYCNSIINGANNCNIIELHNLLFHLTNQNPKQVDDIIVEVFDSYTQKLSEHLANLIKTGNFKIKAFIDLYNAYYQSAQRLSKLMTYFDTRVYSDNTNKYSHINTIRSYMFYKNVISQQYQYIDSKEYYLYEILTKAIESNDGTISEILQLFKMYSFYIRLSYIVKTNKDTLFNSELNKLFLVTLGSNQTFIKTIAQYINDTIKSVRAKDDKTDAANIEELINLISNYFLEKDMFNMYYEKLFESRLLSGEFDNDFEKKLLSKFKRPIDNKIIQNMLYKLKDIEESIADRAQYNKLEITITSDKYKGRLSVDKLNPKIVNARLFRCYAWSHTNEPEKNDLALPFELAPYIDIYNQFYKARYPYRDVFWNFNHGVGTVKITLGAKQYLLQLTTPQMFLLLQFNNSQEITAIDLAKNLDIPLSKVALILNTFIRAQILKKEANKQASDPTMKIILNHNCKFDSDKISLVGSMMNMMQQQQQPIVDKEIVEKFSLGRDTILQAHIIKTIKTSKHLVYDELLTKTKASVPFQFEDGKFVEIVKRCITEKYIKINQDMSYDYMFDEDEDD